MIDLRRRPSKEEIEVWAKFLRYYHKTIGEIERAHHEAGVIPLAWYDVLWGLYSAKGKKLRLHELADRAVLSRSGLTRLVDRLEKEKLLSRKNCPEDARGLYAIITKNGIKALKESWKIYREKIMDLFASRITPAELGELSHLIEKLLIKSS
jgi:DNA-binding MarR family transcriptional regulator